MAADGQHRAEWQARFWCCREGEEAVPGLDCQCSYRQDEETVSGLALSCPSPVSLQATAGHLCVHMWWSVQLSVI